MRPEGNILVVDDEASIREAAAEVLAPRFTVVGADCAAAALDALCTQVFDLILLDYRLPDVPGTEILRLMGKVPRRRSGCGCCSGPSAISRSTWKSG